MKLRSQSKKITTLDKGSIKRDKNKGVEIGVKLKHSVSSTKNASMAGRVMRVRLPTCFPDDPASHSFGATENTDEKGEKVKSESRNPRLQTSFQVEKKKDEYCSLKEAALDHALKGTSIRSCVQSTGPSLGGDAFTSCGETFEAEAGLSVLSDLLSHCQISHSNPVAPAISHFSNGLYQINQLGSGLAGTSTAQPISESDEKTQQISFLPKVMVRGEQHELQYFGSKDSDWVPDNRVKEGRQQLELELEDSDKNAGEPVYEASDLASMKPQLDIDAIFTKQLSITQFRQIIMTLKHERDELKLQRDESNLQRDESNLERDELKVERDELKVERDKLFNEKYVDALQLVNSPQPPVRYQMKRNGGTNSATAMMPEKVAVWPHFFEGQTMYSQSRQSHFKKQGLIRRPRTSACSTLEEEKEEEEEEEEAPVLVRAEANLQNLSENIIYPTLNRLTRMKDDNTRIWTSSKTMCDVNFSGTPDGVTVIWHKDQTTGKWTSGQPITSWENKPEIVLQVVTDSDIVGLYNSDKETNGRWFRVITQIAGNMVHMRAKTAVLSTGIHVNCFLLKPDGMLWISPKIPSNRAGVGSVWNTLDYLLNLPEARDGKLPHLKPVEITVKAASQDVLKPAAGGDSGPGSKPAPAKGKENRSNQTNGTQPEASGGTSIGLSRGLSERPLSGSGAQNVPSCPETSKAKSISSCCNLRYLSMMQEHPDRSTYRAQWRSTAMQAWEDVVVKWYLPESMAMYEIEVACYLRAASMQGSSIAVLLDHGMALHLPGERWPRVGLMVRWAGNSYDVLPPTALVLARQILEELHGLGVVHGDVKTHNMGYDPSTGRVFLFDFSEGRTLPMFKDEATFREACKEDLEMVDWDIEWATAHPQRWQCYI